MDQEITVEEWKGMDGLKVKETVNSKNGSTGRNDMEDRERIEEIGREQFPDR